MPLMHGSSPKAFTKNLKTEMHAGKPQKQALAIAYATKRMAQKGRKMADGGTVDPNEQAFQQFDNTPSDSSRMQNVGKGLQKAGQSLMAPVQGLAEGGDVDDTNEKLHPRHEMIREHMSLVNRMLDSGDRGYAMGGMAGHEQSEYEKEGNIMDESEAHEGLHDVDDPFDHNSQHFPSDMFSEDSRMNSDMSDAEETKKKRYQAMRDAMGM